MKSKFNYLVLILLIALGIAPVTVNAQVRRVERSPKTTSYMAQSLPAMAVLQTQEIVNPSAECSFVAPKKQEYAANFIAVRKKAYVAKNEKFLTKVFIQNSGNMPWFSSDSGCGLTVTNLGTDRTRDRKSIFYLDPKTVDSGWLDGNRIRMETKRVDPNGIAVFSFTSQAPNEDGYYREFFSPVVEGVSWLESAMLSIDTRVGNPVIDPSQKENWNYVNQTSDLSKLNLKGEKSIVIYLSSQKMNLKIGETVIREYPVSTGKPKTPTPVGVTRIIGKNEVRVGGDYPHYIMPKWMMFRRNGYGIHALPSLANDRGVFWREALNHIGQPRSHGCVRLLPQDAAFAYDFTEVGTKVVVTR